MALQIGELFMLGFRGPQMPAWMHDFAHESGLCGAIRFDYDCTDKKYERHTSNRPHATRLCEQIHSLPSHPMTFIDQEGGKVRRLKEQCGVVPLPSARQFGRLTNSDRIRFLRASYTQMREVGIDVNLSPVVDLDINPDSPDVGSTERSYSADPKVVEECVNLMVEVGCSVSLRLFLNHFPGTW